MANNSFGCAVKGDTVVVVKGRKVPKGTTGVVIWQGIGQYGTRVGVKDAAGVVHWTASSNVDVTDRPAPPPPFVGVFAKGDAVRRVSDGKKGKVFWAGEDKKDPSKGRFGVRWAGDKSGEFVAQDDITAWASAKAAPVATASAAVATPATAWGVPVTGNSDPADYDAEYEAERAAIQAEEGGDEGHDEAAHDFVQVSPSWCTPAGAF